MTLPLSVKLTVGILSALPLCACAGGRQTDPVIQGTFLTTVFGQDHDTYEYLAPTASRRLVIIKGEAGNSKLCSEPPPDVGESFSAALASGLQIAAQEGNDTTLGLSGQMARQAATAIAPLLYRTQGLQLYRDSQWSLCNDLLSGYITEYAYEQEKKDRFDKAIPLIMEELKIMKDAQTAFWTNVKSGAPNVDVSSVTAILQAAKPGGTTSPPAPSK